MKRIIYLTILCIIYSFNFSSAQNTSPTWTSIYKGIGDNSDRFNKIISDGSGNFIAVGYTIKPGNYRDFLTVKINSNGDTLWWRTKNGKGNGDDEAVSAGIDASGNVFVTGYTDHDTTQNDILLIKYDANGTVLFDTTWNSPASLDDIPVDLKIDGGGNCIIGGNVYPDTVSGSRDYITLKFDPNGVLLWASQFSRTGVANGKDELSALALDNTGNVFVTGRSFNSSNDDFITIKYDGVSGNQVWLQPANGGGDDRAVAIVVDNASNIIVTGRTDGTSSKDYRTIKYDNAGLLQWTRSYNAPANQDDVPTAITVDANDNIIVTGESDIDQTSFINLDFQTIKYNSAGLLQWAVRTGNVVPQDDHPYAMVIDGSGNIYITGRSDQNISPLQTNQDFMTVKYNASGSLQWSGPLYYSGNLSGSDDVAFSLLYDNNGFVYVAGYSINSQSQKDATIVKYDANSGSESWSRYYNGIGDFNESVKAIVVDANNNSYVAGHTFTDNNNYNAIVCKIDPAGSLLCSYQYQGIKGDDDEFNDIAISSNGIIYAGGYTKVSGQKSNFLLVKWDPATCDTVWTWTYDYIGQSDKIEAIILDASGNIYLTGRSDSNPVDTTDNNDIVTMKLNSNANVQWSQRFNGTGNNRDEPVKIILDNNGDVLVGGRTESNSHLDDDFIVIKYNSSTGAPVWGSPVIYAGSFGNDDRVTDLAVDGSNNIFVCGYSQTSSGNATQDPVVLKIDPSGVVQGFYSYQAGDKDEAVKVALDINNKVYVLFKFDADGGIPLSSNYDYLLKRFDNQLNIDSTFSAQYDSPINGDDIPVDMIISPSNDIYVTGSSENDTLGGRVNNNWVTIGYDPSGAQIFISNYDGPNFTDDSPNALIIRGNNLWVCGYSEGTNNSQKDITVNNYDLTNIHVNEINPLFNSVVYPNPFINDCLISLDQKAVAKNSYIEIFDMLGNSVRASELIIGNTFHLQKGNLSSGIYEYRIFTTDSMLANGKLVVQ